MNYDNFTKEDLILIHKRDQYIIRKISERLEEIESLFNMTFGEIDEAIENE